MFEIKGTPPQTAVGSLLAQTHYSQRQKPSDQATWQVFDDVTQNALNNIRKNVFKNVFKDVTIDVFNH